MQRTLFQFFHWYYPADGSLWKHCREQVARMKELGVTDVWLPPAYKSSEGPNGVGYEVYDLFDLGEFDQKGSVRTKYGTKDEYLACVGEMHNQGIRAIADVVLNHKNGGDDTERFPARKVKADNRNEFEGEEEELEAYTLYHFPGRNKQYSDFVWDWHTFTGVDREGENGEQMVFKILNEWGDTWQEVMGKEFGNFDYLLGADIDYRNPHVRDEIKWWGKWFYETTGINGFRLDAVKHMPIEFFCEWIDYVQSLHEDELFFVSEYWVNDAEQLVAFADAMGGRTQIFDVPLHYNFHAASMEGRNYDLRTIFEGSFLSRWPEKTITFVDNHDTQPLQALESTIDYWFKPHCYALILLRMDGIPSVFYSGYYGAKYAEERDGEEYTIDLAPVQHLHELMKVRKLLAYGPQRDYFNHPNTIGWAREGDDAHELSGVAVVLSNGDNGTKKMEMGRRHAHKTWVDITGNSKRKIKTNAHGNAEFHVKGGKISVWIREEALQIMDR